MNKSASIFMTGLGWGVVLSAIVRGTMPTDLVILFGVIAVGSILIVLHLPQKQKTP